MKQYSKYISLVTFFLLLSFLADARSHDIEVAVDGKQNQIIVSKAGKAIVQIDSIMFDFAAPSSISLLSEAPDEVRVQLHYGAVNDYQKPMGVSDYDVELIISKDEHQVHFYAEPDWARHMSICLHDLGGNYYGLTENLFYANQKSPNLRGQFIDVEVNAEHNRYYENCASAFSAFYFNSLGYGSFVNTYARGSYYIAVNGQTRITHPTGTLDWYVFVGDHKQIYSSYYGVVGKPKYVPQWACGPIIWRDDNKGGSREILDDAMKFTNLEIPITAMFVDRPYSDGNHSWSKMNFNSQFKDPQNWISQLKKEHNLEFMTWIASATIGDQEFPGLFPGFFSYMDLTNSEAKKEWGNRLKREQYVHGVKGHKLDRGDEFFPDSEKWDDKTPEFERKNKYAFLYAQVTDSIISSYWGRDQFTFARSAYHGVQPYLSAIWGGDVRTSWDGMASNLANAIRSSYMGFSNWGSDVGGYIGSGRIPEDLYIRWMQFGLWTGFFEIKLDGSGGKGQTRLPWDYGVSLQNTFREICEQRMKFLPYTYSSLNQAGRLGPLIKPMAMVYPEDNKVADIWDQYLFGDALLVAPVVKSNQSRMVYLPKGEWVDYITGEIYKGRKSYQLEVALEKVPVFVKKGGLFVTGNTTKGNSVNWRDDRDYLNIHLYPDRHSEFSLVEDHVYPITADRGKNSLKINVPAIQKEGQLVIYATKNISKASINGAETKAVFDSKSNVWLLPYHADRKLEIELFD